MRNSAKGVLAAGAAVALLVGGGGTLAFWSDSNLYDIDSTLGTGSLSLGEVSCDDWTLDAAEGGGTFDPATDELVPGDTLTRTCTSVINAEGKHLNATIGLSGGATNIDQPLVDEGFTLTSAVTKTAPAGTPESIGTSISSLDDGYTLTATFTATFPYGGASPADNDSMSQIASIADLTITAVQVHD